MLVVQMQEEQLGVQMLEPHPLREAGLREDVQHVRGAVESSGEVDLPSLVGRDDVRCIPVVQMSWRWATQPPGTDDGANTRPASATCDSGA